MVNNSILSRRINVFESKMKGLKSFSFRLFENRSALIGSIIVGVFVALAILAPWIAPHNPITQYRGHILVPPFWQEGGSLLFPLGTDDLGRDMASRLMYGARLSMSLSLLIVSLATVIGVTIGLCAGYFRGTFDFIVMRCVDLLMSIPGLLLALVVVAILGPDLLNAMLAVSIVMLPGYIRISRACMMSESARDYVTAARVSGCGHARLIFVEILPNCLAPLIVQSTLGLSTAIIDMAALGFLGLGAQPPQPEWGTMLAGATRFSSVAWWMVALPGLCIVTVVLAFNLLGDGLRDTLDPKLKY